MDKNIISPSVDGRPTLWKPTPRFKQKPISESIAFNTLKPMLWVLRTIAKLPWTTDKSGRMQARLMSMCSLYNLVAYLFQTFLMYDSATLMVSGLITSQSFVGSLFLVITLAISSSQVFTPFSIWYETPALANYINTWVKLEEDMKLIGAVLQEGKKMRVFVSVFTVLSCAALVFFAYLHASLMNYGVFQVLLFFIVYTTMQMHLLVWTFTCVLLVKAGNAIADSIVQEQKLGVSCTAQEVGLCRSVWMELSFLAGQLGIVIGPSVIVTSVIAGSTFIASAFSLLSAVSSPHVSEELYGFASFMLPTFLEIFILCETGHRASQAVGSSLFERLLRTNLTHLGSECHKEVTYLIQAMRGDQMNVTMCGYVVVNRSLFVSFLSLTITYLIVLVQFKAADTFPELSATNASLFN